MSILLYISGSIALLALAGLLVYLINVLKEVKGLVGSANQTLTNLSVQVNAQLNNVDTIVKNVGKLTDDVTVVVNDTTEIIHEGQRIILSIMELEQTLQQSIQAPIVETMTVFSALGRGIRAFRQKIAGNGDGPALINDGSIHTSNFDPDEAGHYGNGHTYDSHVDEVEDEMRQELLVD